MMTVVELMMQIQKYQTYHSLTVAWYTRHNHMLRVLKLKIAIVIFLKIPSAIFLAKYYLNWFTFGKVVVKIKRVTFF